MNNYSLTSLFFISVFLQSLISPLIPYVFADETKSACITTNVGNPKNSPQIPPECQTSGSGAIPTKERSALLASIKQAVDAKKITFAQQNDREGMTNGTGKVKRMDGQMVEIDTKLLQIYVYLVNQGYTFTISSMVGTHNKFSSSGNVSRHWDGFGADFSIINGAVVNQTSAKSEVIKMMKTFNALIGKELAPRQVICQGAGRLDPEVDAFSMNGAKLAPGFSRNIPGHTDHIHIGY